MNSSLTNLKNLGTLFTAAVSLLLAATSSHALSVNLAPDQFTSTLGEADDVVGNHPIDEATAPDGFGGAFTNDFLLLGSPTTATTIRGDGFNDSNSGAQSSLFSITSDDITDGIVVNFNWAFNGDSPGFAGLDQDNFSISLIKSDSSAFASVLTSAATAGYGSGSESVTINTGTLTAGDYRLQINLNENSSGLGTFSTAAGFNQITLENPSVSVPFEFSPSLGLIIMGGIFVTTHYAKSRKAKQDLLNI